MAIPAYGDKVFINCPFDDRYKSLFDALVFVIYRCGFFPVCAVMEDNGIDQRIDKLIRMIGDCKFAVHDLSRIETNENNLPRFNMPFELGLFWGAKKFGNTQQQSKNAVVFERSKFQYQQFISDINGIDTKAHNNNVSTIMEKTRDWLRIASGRTTIPGNAAIFRDWIRFRRSKYPIARRLHLDHRNLIFNDYCLIVEEYIKAIQQ